MSKAKPVEVRINLPLPFDIASTLIKVIGATWPGTLIKQGDSAWKTERQLILEIPDKERHKDAKKRKRYHAEKQFADAFDGQLTELGPDGVGLSPHQHLVALWVDLARQSFDMWPGASNYLESTASDKDTGERYVFWVAKSPSQTPHELRKRADARVAELEAEVARLKAQLAECER